MNNSQELELESLKECQSVDDQIKLQGEIFTICSCGEDDRSLTLQVHIRLNLAESPINQSNLPKEILKTFSMIIICKYQNSSIFS